MQLQKLFEIQAAFEKEIVSNTSIEENVVGEENVLDIHFLALHVKIGELANLTKCYKYYHIKPNLPKHKLVIRYSDVLRYLLSLGNRHQFNMIQTADLNTQIESTDVIQVFSCIIDHMASLKKAIRNDHYVEALNLYITIFSYFVHLGSLLQLTEEDIQNHFETTQV